MTHFENNTTKPGKHPLLEVRNLKVAFRSDSKDVLAVKGISFKISQGETVALVGESGSGKSVSALSILKLLPYPSASHPAGEINFEGRNLLKASEKEINNVRGDRISIIFQEPMTSLNPLHTLEKQVGEVLKLHQGMNEKKTRKRVIELLSKVGIPNPEMRLSDYPHQLSGGQRQRVMIAMALANKPDLLIADEPTTALDVTIQAQILQLLVDLKKEMGLSLLLITHDLGVVRRMADRVYVMRHGEIVEEGLTKKLFQNPTHPYTQHLIESEPKGRVDAQVSHAPSLLEVDNLKVWFPIKRGVFRRTVDHVKAVDGVSLKLQEGNTLGIVGESGSGKTTLGLAILRLVTSEGPIIYSGRNIQGLNSKAMRPLRKQMQIVFQDPYGSLSPRLPVCQIIEEGLQILNPELGPVSRRQKVRESLKEVGLDPESLDRYPHEFSGGQRQRIAIARALILEPKLIMLDEPTSALDQSVQAQIVDLLREVQKRHGLGYLFISHDLKVVRALCTYVLVMRNGKVVEKGPVDQIFETPQEEYTKSLLSAAFDLKIIKPNSFVRADMNPLVHPQR